MPSSLGMAAGEGFEPSHTESESAVLPLHNPAICLPLLPANKYYYTHIAGIVNKNFFKNRYFFKVLSRVEKTEKTADFLLFSDTFRRN